MNLLDFIHSAPEGSSFKIDVVEGFEKPLKFLRNCKTKEKCAVPPPGEYVVCKNVLVDKEPATEPVQ